ncbi:MAG: hypothetical protein FWD57_04515 [Polyangiaceae bacterium]|nr:hypothetical protein [Polyangiaceae bacterium]
MIPMRKAPEPLDFDNETCKTRTALAENCAYGWGESCLAGSLWVWCDGCAGRKYTVGFETVSGIDVK